MSNLKLLEKNVENFIPDYVEYYYQDPDYYRNDEGYKFRAVNTFRSNFNLKADNLSEMLKKSFADSHNLTQSGQYFPKRMLLRYAEEDEEFVRDELKKLLFEDMAVGERIENFIKNFDKNLVEENEKSYFDCRFLSFILSSYDPHSHFYVKWSEYIEFADLVGYDLEVNVRSSQGKKYEALSSMIEAVRLVLKNNDNFQEMHKDLVSTFEYKDPFITWGAQDFIFNVVRRLTKKEKQIKMEQEVSEMEQEAEESVFMENEEWGELEGKTKEEILKEAQNYKPTKRSEKTTKIEIRRESTKQKKRVKELEDYRCQVCSDNFAYENTNGKKVKYVEVDHIKPYSEDGTEDLDNLWTLCPTCHKKKTLGVITVNKVEGAVLENGEEIDISNNHLSWYTS